ncbi:thermonuclease family protein (plasmid) [Agrobacterium sp. 13-2099-1-2]|uniref:thermonuclease family protein n=1 Tax=Agrobacterium sp. 13-2099-1-2 TaxID=1841651 RepID=UPI00080FE6D0|nr:thermonuclease family protein [Agrobacterium sp. 13-2099-1-2]UZX45534.1 thermonuclease family protein [Agrobacterium sp. 13-2099-1-2]
MKRFSIVCLATFAAITSSAAIAADLVKNTPTPPAERSSEISRISGHVSVIDGRTIWYPQYAQKVRLADVDACELPQWALNPDWQNRDKIKAPPPVPCGPLAKAWLKRSIGGKSITCDIVTVGSDGTPEGYCVSSRGGDLALEMLRVGWARVSGPFPRNSQYLLYQTSAMAARYGMWATYVLDMNEWRRRAVDRTLERQPIADFNLLATRQGEISPPFADARNKPHRTDR